MLAGEREGEEQKAEDRERAKNIAELRVGDVLGGGPQLCVVAYKLDNIWTFLQVPYRSGKVAADVNGVWDSAFMTWAEVAESQLGAEGEIVPGVERILQFVRKSSLTGHVAWPDQARCDYPGVALWFFNRDYRAYREKRLDKSGAPTAKPSLLAIMNESVDFLSYLRMALEWGGFGGAHCRQKKQPYASLLLGSAPPKGERLALGVNALEDDVDAEEQPSKRAKERKRKEELKKKRPADDRKPPADDRKPPKRQPGPGDKPPPHVGGGDKPPMGPRPQGSAWPNKKHLQTPDMAKVLQAKMDQSSGLDKGSCVACLLGTGVGCPDDNRVGCEGKCGHSHQGPKDRKVGEGYHDRRVLDQLCDGHGNMSRCDRVTVLSANHSGALRFHEAVGKQFVDDSADDVGWLQPVAGGNGPLRLDLNGETVEITGFVATCPARIEPCNGVQQNSKVRTTTDKWISRGPSWRFCRRAATSWRSIQ